MAHNHGKEYQIRTVHEDGTEELSGWMQSEAQVAPALAAFHRPDGTAYWLRARTVLCPDCRASDQGLWECPLTSIPTSRYSPHDSVWKTSGARGSGGLRMELWTPSAEGGDESSAQGRDAGAQE